MAGVNELSTAQKLETNKLKFRLGAMIKQTKYRTTHLFAIFKLCQNTVIIFFGDSFREATSCLDKHFQRTLQ